MYPLMSAQLDKYLEDGTAWEYPKIGAQSTDNSPQNQVDDSAK